MKSLQKNKDLEERNWTMLANQSCYVADKANDLVENGDSYLAQLLALEALPKDLERPNRPYVPDAEYALRQSSLKDDVILRGHKGVMIFASFSPDGSKVVSAFGDGTVCVWDVATGRKSMFWKAMAVVSFPRVLALMAIG